MAPGVGAGHKGLPSKNEVSGNRLSFFSCLFASVNLEIVFVEK